MTTFWRIGDNYINPREIVRIERDPATPAREGVDEFGEAYSLKAQSFKLRITLTELDCKSGGWDHNSGYGEYAIPANLVIVISGAEAERFDAWLMEGMTVYPTSEPGGAA